ncbi:MAG: PH domain-containing protein [Clostridiales Family XIII bacterium]|jgi:putative membrane protein|nr:PH domain-containing protein [Clostridiales Family XIII bacterium]
MNPLEGRHRVHWSYILTKTLGNLRQWIFAIIIPIVSAFNSVPALKENGGLSFRNPYLLVTAGAILLLVAAISVLQYFRLTWEVTDTEVRLRKGVFRRTDSRIPFTRVHSVNIKANVIEQAFGVVSFNIDTAGQSTAVDAIIPSLEKPLANELRARIEHMKNPERDITGRPREFQAQQTAPGMFPPIDAENATFDRDRAASDETARVFANPPPGFAREDENLKRYRIRTSELLLHGLSNGKTTLYLFLALSFLYQLADIPFLENLLSDTMDSALRYFAALNIFFVIIAVICVLLIVWAVSVISSVLKYFDFTVQRRGDRIEIDRGLLTHKTIGKSVDRIQELHIRRSLLRRIIGYAEIRVKMASIDAEKATDAEGPGVPIHPFIKYREIDGFLREILPEFSDAPEIKTGLPRASLRRTYFRYFRGYALFIAAVVIPAWQLLREFAPSFPRASVLLAISGGFFAFLCVTAYRSWRGRGMTTNETFLVMRRGAYGIKTVIIPRRKIQIARIRQNPFQQRVRVAHVSAQSGGLGTFEETILDADEESALSYMDWVRPRRTSEEHAEALRRNSDYFC